MEPKLELFEYEQGELDYPNEYWNIIWGLRYLTNTRPNISYVVGMMSRDTEHPTVKHIKVEKRILTYIKGTMDYGLVYVKVWEKDIVIGYNESDLAREIFDRRSTTWIAFHLNRYFHLWH